LPPDQTGYGLVDIALGDLSVASAMLSFDIPVMGSFVLPLLAVTLVVLAVRHWWLTHPGRST